MQVLIVIRHAESEFNAASRAAPGWTDPKIFDPAITQQGCQQALRLRAQLAEELRSNPCLRGSSNVLWVTSPLRRCIQTFLLSCPLLPEGGGSADGSAASGQLQQRIERKLAAMQKHALPKLKVVR